MAEAFIPIPQKYLDMGYTAKTLVVDHIRDWDPLNHDDHSVYNLQWLTYAENSQKYVKYKNCKDPIPKFTNKEINEMVGEYKTKYDDEHLIRSICEELVKNKLTIREIAEKFDVKKGFVHDLKKHRCWKNITYQYELEKHDLKDCVVNTYSEAELKFLDELINRNASNDEIRKLMNWERNKTTSALISSHRKKLNKNISTRTVYSEEFIDKLHTLMKEGKSNKEIKELLNLESSQKTYNLFAVHRKLLERDNL